MEYVNIPGTSLSPSRIGLGTWAIGGWMWSDTDEERSEDPGSASVRNFQGGSGRHVRAVWESSSRP